MPDYVHQSHQWDQLPASTPETSCLVGQVRLLLVEVVPEYRSAPTPDPARPNIRAMGTALHPRCPCRSERQDVPRFQIQLAKKTVTMYNHAQSATTQESTSMISTLLCHAQHASVYSSFSSKIGFPLAVELHDWVVGRYGSETPIDSGGAAPQDARTGWCCWDA